jgi:hypothetical protein
MNVRFSHRAALAAAAFLFSGSAFAHAKLVSSTPADNAEVSAPQKIELQFSESLVTKFSGASLLATDAASMAGMPDMKGMQGMSDHTMKVPAKVSGSDDPKTMVITPNQPLVPGKYRVQWQAVSSDTHRVTGTISFTVK